MRILVSTLLLSLAAPAAAQNFGEVAENASEVPGELRRFGQVLWEQCSTGSATERRQCNRRRRRDLRTLRSTRWLASVPARGNVEIGPYETVREGFLVRVPDLMLRANGGMLTTRQPENGALARFVLSERFFVVPPERAERWFRRNAIERMRLRVVFRFGRNWQMGSQKGAVIEAVGIQIYNSSTGNVLVDSISNPAPPPGGPIDLDQRVMLWDQTQVKEARWRSPDGTPLLFSVRVDRGRDGARHPVLVETRGVTPRDVARFNAPPQQDSSLAVIPRGADNLLVVFTERRPSGGDPGHGVVHLYRWRDDGLVLVTQWQGSNDQNPPAWIVDPNAPLPE